MSQQPSTGPVPSARSASKRWALFVFALVGLLLTAAAFGSWTYWSRSSKMDGLEGTWRDSHPTSRHTYQFRANGKVDAWYGNLPMGNFMKWERDGSTITVKTERNWDFVGELAGEEIRGKHIIRDERGEPVNTIDAVWRRE